MLGPPMEFYHPFTVDEVMSEEATAELRDEAIHSLSVEAGLFTMSRAGQLTSAIDFSQDFGDLYSRIRSLDELAALIEREVSPD